MSYISNSWVKKRSLIRSLLVVTGYISLIVQSNLVSAEQEWWFDVEVIVFKRNVHLTEISEKFPIAQPSLPSPNNVDLFTPYLNPDLSYLEQNIGICNEPNSPIYEWGPALIMTDETVDADLTGEDTMETEMHNQGIDSAFKTNTQEELVDSTTQFVSDTESVTSTLQQTVVDLNREDPYYQKSVDLNADNGLTQADAETSHEFELFKAENILGSFVTIQFPTTLPCVYPEQLALLTNPFDKTDAQGSIHNASKVLRVPINIDGIEWTERYEPYLLPQSLLTLSTLFEDISRQQDLIPLLHAGWRQEVKFGEDQALAFRLFAGKNFADTFSSSGELLVSELDSETTSDSDSDLGFDIYSPLEPDKNGANRYPDTNHRNEVKADSAPILDLTPQKTEQVIDEESLFSRINKVLSDDSPIEFDEKGGSQFVDLPVQQALMALWELDGKLKVYLQNVGRTPYLHIDTNLEYRSPIFIANKQVKEENKNQNSIVVGEQITQANYLQSVQFDQLRRVISKQLHYFDHPLFGMIVHITRYNRPEPVIEEATLHDEQIAPETK